MQSAPKPPPATIVQQTAPPKETDRAVQEAIAEAMRRRTQRKGWQSTILANYMMDDQTRALQSTLGT